MRTGYKRILPFLPLFFFAGSCKKFIQISPPTTELVTASVFSNSNTATSTVTAIYTKMFQNDESFNMARNQGLLSDELTDHSTNVEYIQFYTNALEAVNNYGDWNNAYNYIYQANAIIAGLQNNANIPPAIAQQLTGEAIFIRAFWHFYLTNMYGDVPLVTTTLYTVNTAIARTPQSQVYSQIILDLKAADSLLNINYVDATDTTITTDRVRPTKGAAEALLARAYLYYAAFPGNSSYYDSAEIAATSVIGDHSGAGISNTNNGLYSLCTNLNPAGRIGRDSVFLANSEEAIWQLATPLPASINTADAQGFYLLSAPGTGSTLFSVSPQLLNSFETDDLRRRNWIDSIIVGGRTYYFPSKYQAVNTGSITEYTMVLRLAEQYLIRAEAEAQLGDMTDATNDLNTIRTRAGLGPSPTLTASSSLQQADSAILHERQVELFTEWGHRWFDLIRMDSANAVMGSPGNVCQYKGGSWNLDWQLYPIPQTEITSDPHLTQNPGY